jgi:hypothetical protein
VRDEETDGLECFSTEGIVPVIETADNSCESFPSERLAHVGRSSSPVVVVARKVSSIPAEWWTMAAGIAVVVAGIASVWIGTPRPPVKVAVPATDAPVPVAAPSPGAAASSPTIEDTRLDSPLRSESVLPKVQSSTRSEPSHVPDSRSSRRQDTVKARPVASSKILSTPTPLSGLAEPSVAPRIDRAADDVREDLVLDPPRRETVPAVIVAPAISDREAIEGVLHSYERAYDVRDAASTAVIWPRVDTRALSRAFNTLAQQDLSFDRCELRIVGAGANAQCTGEIRYIRRVGDQVERARRVSWSFVFERVGDRWQFAHVTAD